MSEFKVVTSDFVTVQISTSKDDLSFSEKRFAKDITISDLKNKLELMTGANAATMKIEVYSKDSNLICTLSNDSALLGSYPIDNGARIHIIDKFILRNEFEFSNVQKYEMTEEDYTRKSDSLRNFFAKNKQGKYSDEYIRKKEQQEKEEKEAIDKITLNSRCKVTVQNAPTKLGTVMYTGLVEGLAGYWVGIKYDEPLGKNDGSIKGKKYFECQQNYGAFVKPASVTIGDFPEEDFDLNDEI